MRYILTVILILSLIAGMSMPVIIIGTGLDKSDAAPILIMTSLALFLYAILALIYHRKMKRKIIWSMLSIVLAVGTVYFNYSYLGNNLFATDTNKQNYSGIIAESKRIWPEMLGHMPDELPSGECSYFMQTTFDTSKIQLSTYVSENECEEIYEKAKSAAIYSQKGFDLSKSERLWSTRFRSFDNSEYVNLTDDYEVFILYVSGDRNKPVEDWQNNCYNSGVVVNTEKKFVIYWAVFP